MRRTIGVNTWVWTSPLDDASLAVIAAKAAGMGFGAIELPVEQPGDWSPDAAADVLAEHRLAPIVIGAMGPGRNLVAAPGSEVVATQNYLVHCIGVAERLGSRVVAGPFTAATGRAWRMDADEREARYRELRASLSPVVRAAERSGIRLAIEPLNRYETSLVNTVEQALDALGPLLGPGLGLALDSYHLNIVE
jgi:D-psicose/D-tagatose/L-ribulose 3-epimerase